MFWASSLKSGTTVNLGQQANAGELLHLSQANLVPESPAGRNTVFVTH